MPIGVCVQNYWIYVAENLRPILRFVGRIKWNLNSVDDLNALKFYHIVHKSGLNVRHRFSTGQAFPVVGNEVDHLFTVLSELCGVHCLRLL